MSERIPDCPHPDEEIFESEHSFTCLKCRRAVSRNISVDDPRVQIISCKVETGND